MESRLKGQTAGFGASYGLRHYLNIVLTTFLRDLIIVGGTFLCVLPGLYFAYCYYMVPYILAENPEMKPMEALRLSKQMMEGHKMNTWLLEMSFFGWMFLGAMACGVGTFFVLPYYYATFAELYAVLRAPYGGELNGFGYPEVVPTGSFGGTYVNQADSAGNGQYGGYGQTQAGADHVHIREALIRRQFAGRTMYRVMETKQMQKEAEYSVEDRVKERPAGPKLRDRVRSILQKIRGTRS